MLEVENLKLSNGTNSGGLAIFSRSWPTTYATNSTKDRSANSTCEQDCKCYKVKAKGIVHVEERRI